MFPNATNLPVRTDPPSPKSCHRKKKSRCDHATPVTINPQLVQMNSVNFPPFIVRTNRMDFDSPSVDLYDRNNNLHLPSSRIAMHRPAKETESNDLILSYGNRNSTEPSQLFALANTATTTAMPNDLSRQRIATMKATFPTNRMAYMNVPRLSNATNGLPPVIPTSILPHRTCTDDRQCSPSILSSGQYILRPSPAQLMELNPNANRLDLPHLIAGTAPSPYYLFPAMNFPSKVSKDNEEQQPEILSNEPKKKKRKEKISGEIDLRTKSQWKHISRRNRLAVLRYLMRKRKEKIEHRSQMAKIQLDEPVVIETVPEPISETPENNVIATNLKVSFNSSQQIECISLYYHRKQPMESNNATPIDPPLKIPENKLDLLLEAVEFIETRREKTSLSLDSDK